MAWPTATETRSRAWVCPRDTLSRLEDRNPSANEVIHDRQICMLLSLLSVCSLCPRFISMLSPLSLLSFHYDSATLTDCIQSVVHSCSKCLHSHNRLLPSSSSAPSPPPPPPPPREAIESGGQKTAWTLVYISSKAEDYFFSSEFMLTIERSTGFSCLHLCSSFVWYRFELVRARFTCVYRVVHMFEEGFSTYKKFILWRNFELDVNKLCSATR